MAKIERFEDLQSWQKARLLTNLVYDLTGHTEFAKDFRLRDQIRDAAGSVMHNIAEGFDSGSNPEFIRFMKMARRSASEVQSQLYLALDRNYLIVDEKIALVDTVWTPYAAQLLANIAAIVDPSRIDYVITNHAEVDHSGALPELMRHATKATMIVSRKGSPSMCCTMRARRIFSEV